MNLMFLFFTICKIILKLYFGYRRENDEAEKKLSGFTTTSGKKKLGRRMENRRSIDYEEKKRRGKSKPRSSIPKWFPVNSCFPQKEII